MEIKITIKGDCPSKKNSRVLSFKGNRPRSFPSQNYSLWHRGASLQLLAYNQKKLLFVPGSLAVAMTFFPSTKRKSDLTNKAESVMDLLVDNGFLPDDNWFEVEKIWLKFGKIDKQNPRVEIVITEGVARV